MIIIRFKANNSDRLLITVFRIKETPSTFLYLLQAVCWSASVLFGAPQMSYIFESLSVFPFNHLNNSVLKLLYNFIYSILHFSPQFDYCLFLFFETSCQLCHKNIQKQNNYLYLPHIYKFTQTSPDQSTADYKYTVEHTFDKE
jgi:hypothetical protein